MFRDSLGLRGADLSRALADLLFGGVQGQVQVQVSPGCVTEFSGVSSVWTWGVDWVTHVFRRCSMQSAVCAIVSALVCLGGAEWGRGVCFGGARRAWRCLSTLPVPRVLANVRRPLLP